MNGSKLELVVSPNVGQLLEAAADGFFLPLHATAETPFPSPNYLLALRQGGLRDDVIRLAARKGCKGWFDPPLCIFHELPRWLGERASATLGEIERRALLGNIVRSTGGGVFGQLRRLDYYLGALDSFFGEIIAEGITAEGFDLATAELTRKPASFAARKNAELAKIYRSYLQALDEADVNDGRDNLVAAARLIAADGAALTERLRGRREVRFYGLADLRGGWRKLLAALVDSPVVDKVRIFSTREFSDAELAGLPHLDVTHLRGDANIAASLFQNAAGSNQTEPHGQFAVLEAPNTERETSEVAIRVRQLVDAGTPLHRIAVVARRGRPHVDLVKRALDVVGVPATARLRIAFNEIPVVKAVLSLLAAAADGWTRQSLVELANQTHFKALLDPRVLNFIGYRRVIRGLPAWQSAINDLLFEIGEGSGAETDESHRSDNTPSRERISEAQHNFELFSELVSGLNDRCSLHEWIGWLTGFLTDDPLEVATLIYAVPEHQHDAVKRDIAGWNGLLALASEWQRSVEVWGDISEQDTGNADAISIGEFSKRLREMLDGQVGIWTSTQRGVAVLEGLAAAYREFDHVFLVGMEAGSFPLPPPKSPVLDDDDRSQLGDTGLHLDTREDWNFRERDLFRTLVSGAKQITVSYPTVDSRGKATIRSAFVEALAEKAEEVKLAVDEFSVLTPGTPLVRSDAALAQARHAAYVERQRGSDNESAHGGNIADASLRAWLAETFNDDKLWSPSQIESYAKCPWAYFSGRLLGMQKYEDPDEEMEASVRGSLLHDTLARFYDRVGEKRGRPVFLTSADLEWAKALMEETLDVAFDDMEKRAWMGHPVLRDFKRIELKRDLVRYLDWEVEHHERMDNKRTKDAFILRTGADAHEQSFGKEGDVVLERNGVSFKFRGFIDRVDIGVDPRIDNPSRFVAAIDYKSSIKGVPGEGKPAAWNDGVVLQVPLYAYALTQIKSDVEVSRVEYRPLRETKPGATPGKARPHCMQLYQVDRKTGVLNWCEEDAAKMERALDSVCEHVLNARRGKFPVSPAPSCGCPPYCHAYDVCRVSPEAREGKR